MIMLYTQHKKPLTIPMEWLFSCKNPRGRHFKNPRVGEKMPSGQLKNRPTYSNRPEKNKAVRSQWEHNKKIILATQSVCGICGKPVDKSLKYPNPMSPTVDHIIPVAKNGDPVALDNLQLAHMYCNRMKSDKMPVETKPPAKDEKKKFICSANWRTD